MILNRKADSQKDYTEYGKKQEIKIQNNEKQNYKEKRLPG